MPDSRRLKVAYILTPVTFGGAEKVSLNFFKSVNLDRFDIKPILITRPWEEKAFFYNELVTLGYEKTIIEITLNPRGGVISVLGVAWKIFNHLKNNKYDIVHTHGYFADICSLIFARIFGARCITTCHGFILSDRKLKIYNALDKCAIRCCHSILAVSDTIKGQLICSSIDPKKITVLSNAVEIVHDADALQIQRQRIRSSLKVDDETFVIGSLGRLSPEKGLIVLFRALKELLSLDFNISLVIVGDGPERSALEEFVTSNKMENSVHFSGFQTDTIQWLSAFDCFVLPSFTEGTPLSLLEAMTVGLPVVASSVGGVPNVIQHGKNGLLIGPNDSDAIVKNITSLISDPERALKLGDAGKDTVVRDYSLKSWCCKIENIYDNKKLIDLDR